MFKKTIIIILSVLFLSIASINYTISNPPTFEDLKAFYPEILFDDLENYNYTINEYGNNFYLVEINGVTYIVKI